MTSREDDEGLDGIEQLVEKYQVNSALIDHESHHYRLWLLQTLVMDSLLSRN